MVLKKIIFQNRYVELETPPPLHGICFFFFWGVYNMLEGGVLKKIRLERGETYRGNFLKIEEFFLE